MNNKRLEEKVKTAIAKAINREITSINSKDLLIGDYGVDSVQILNIIANLEEEMDLSFEDEDLSFDVFHSVQTLLDFVASLMRKNS